MLRIRNVKWKFRQYLFASSRFVKIYEPFWGPDHVIAIFYSISGYFNCSFKIIANYELCVWIVLTIRLLEEQDQRRRRRRRRRGRR